VNFTFLPISTARIILLIGLVYLIILWYVKFPTSINIDKGVLIVILLYVLYFVWIFFISVYQELKDVAILSNALLLLIHPFIGGLFFSLVFHKMDYTLRDVILVIQIVIFIQAIFIVIYFVSWDFREFTFNFIPETGNIDHKETLFRSRGLTHSSGAGLSVVQAMGLLFTSYLIATIRYKSKQFLYLIFSFGLLVISIGITGRTGLLMLPLVFSYIIVLMIRKSKMPKNLIYFTIIIPLVIIASYLLFKHGYMTLVDEGDTAVFDRLVRWYTKEFYGESQVQSRTVKILLDHWFLPEDSSTLLFGDPTTWNVNRIRSDIGLVRRLHGAGFIGIVLIYTLYLFVFLYIIIKSKKLTAKLLFALLGLFLFIIEVKEPMFTRLPIASVYMLFFPYFLLRKK